METLNPIIVPSIHQEVQDRIKEYILVNNLQPGDPLPSETQLVDQLEVSRAVVREALRALESVGVIFSRRGAGHYVNEFNLDPIVDNLAYSMRFDKVDVRDLLDVRAHLEVSFVGDAIAAMDCGSLAQLRSLIDQMRQNAAAGLAFVQEDLAFHQTIFMTTHNHLLVKLLNIFWDVYQNLRDESSKSAQDLDVDVRNHDLILQAIEAKEVPLARRRLIDHFRSLEQRL